ncbi:hypothetical protein AVEN_247492-1 [Araneus ventricosus]|uniref:Uncharacterized protein n=1 Tax=Araneus ventricosus TaxID=182803 RepID=A0A4Y2GZH1_ARAVE|nr:hypothetical protein AVEN_247492-1 [Araneus ventricosus]
MRSLQAKWHDSTPHRSNFQFIHLGGSFTEALCKRSLPSPRATVSTPPLAFKTWPQFRSDSPPPRVYIVWFSLLGESLASPPLSRISVLEPNAPIG